MIMMKSVCYINLIFTEELDGTKKNFEGSRKNLCGWRLKLKKKCNLI